MRTHREALGEIGKILTQDKSSVPDAFGHRVVHGGELFSSSALITDRSLEMLEKTKKLAPIHNPPAMEIIRECLLKYPGIPSVAVFDTAFHSTIPSHASTYCLPSKVSAKLQIKKYGFHGTSHRFVIEEASKLLEIPISGINAVSCHLGSGGASLCAVQNGKSIDNTMGYSPLQGLVMSTRCGDLDPALAMSLLQHFNGRTFDVERFLNNKSGVLGMSGYSSDIRDILSGQVSDKNYERTQKTLEAYLWRIRKYLGSYLAVVTRPDAVIFTDTIGETIPQVRWAACADMDAFGVKIDYAKNKDVKSLPAIISESSSKVKILVIATNEELAIARDVHCILKKILNPMKQR
jgi:acetate kinase